MKVEEVKAALDLVQPAFDKAYSLATQGAVKAMELAMRQVYVDIVFYGIIMIAATVLVTLIVKYVLKNAPTTKYRDDETCLYFWGALSCFGYIVLFCTLGHSLISLMINPEYAALKLIVSMAKDLL